MNYRLYTFVAGLYLSELQKGLQTAHVVSEIAAKVMDDFDNNRPLTGMHAFSNWANKDKTIIICNAGNHKGVLECWAELKRTAIDPGFVTGAIFHEDEQSMNGMATACGVIVPEQYWDVTFDPWAENGLKDRWVYPEKGEVKNLYTYDLTTPVGQFISHIKKYRLA